MDDFQEINKVLRDAIKQVEYNKASEKRLEARWYIDSVVGDEVLIDLNTHKIIARRPQRQEKD